MVQISMGPLDFHHEFEKLALEKMRFCALKANRGGLAGKLPERPRIGIPRG